MKTGIIIPCYNEGSRLNANAFIEFIKSHKKYHLCFVNDGSKDDTLEVLHDIQKEMPRRVSILNLKKNVGKAAAVGAGARYLFNRQNIEYIGFIDADLSTGFNDFEKMVDTLHNYDNLSLVYGSRRKGFIRKNLFRNLFSRLVKLIVFLILELPIKDTQCGAKVFRRDIIPIIYNKAFLTKWLFDVEIFIRLKKYFGSKDIMNRVFEQPLEKWIHRRGSKLTMKDILRIPYMLISIWAFYSFLSLSGDAIEVDKAESFDNIKTIDSNDA
ncbi:glycosyltransferase [Flavivirga eckloniae]|uniref:Glycosyl transferase family 2 n=1 Tax=Flavivirga eckloniae TaxID=1803846 RepID=A0A2K9PKT3_9FLAO|nr:glycosyltransferase [Flavivirga eckloniae]AUP77636.1 glycosyl transferase family 2 [Flavivirga eckloniae]